MTPYQVSCEMMWRVEPEVEQVRKHPAWAPFHRECGKTGLFFDHIERQGGRRGQFVATAYTLVKRVTMKLADGRGKTPAEAVADAYAKAGRPVPAAEPLLAQILGGSTEEEEFDNLLGGDEPTDDFEGLLG